MKISEGDMVLYCDIVCEVLEVDTIRDNVKLKCEDKVTGVSKDDVFLVYDLETLGEMKAIELVWNCSNGIVDVNSLEKALKLTRLKWELFKSMDSVDDSYKVSRSNCGFCAYYSSCEECKLKYNCGEVTDMRIDLYYGVGTFSREGVLEIYDYVDEVLKDFKTRMNNG